MKALIDSDSLIYKHAAINQDVIEWDEDTTTVVTNLEAAKDGLEKNIQAIIEAVDAEDYLLVLSPKHTFRYDIFPEYKGNRAPPKHPLKLLKPLRAFAMSKFKTHTPTYVEADDYCVWKIYEEPYEWVLCHIDKDLNQAIGVHYNYNKLDSYIVDQEEADTLFYTQTLTGDSSDGYKGCPGIGPKKAEKILQNFNWKDGKGIWKAIVSCYEDKKLDEDDALVQARLARMLRPTEYNGDDVINMWRP